MGESGRLRKTPQEIWADDVVTYRVDSTNEALDQCRDEWESEETSGDPDLTPKSTPVHRATRASQWADLPMGDIANLKLPVFDARDIVLLVGRSNYHSMDWISVKWLPDSPPASQGGNRA